MPLLWSLVLMSAASLPREAPQPHAIADDPIILCPNCGSHDYRSNLIDERPFREAARSAKMLRRLGHLGAAADVLTRLAAVRIQNFLRCKHHCNDCAAQFDE